MFLLIQQACKPRALNLLLLLPKCRQVDFSMPQGYVFQCEIATVEVLILLVAASPANIN